LNLLANEAGVAKPLGIEVHIIVGKDGDVRVKGMKLI